MQIRLTVVDPLGPPTEPRGHAAARGVDVLVTAPAGTALAAVASALVSAVAGGDGPAVLYAGAERLDAQRCTLGEPPLTDGAVLSLGAPAEHGPDESDVAAQLHVVAGPDAGGVHLLHGGQIRLGRSADADVPLDDPDVSRLHCAVTVAPDGRISVADLGSTNGTVLDGTRVGERPVRFAPGALLRVGESALRLAPPTGVGTVPTAPDGEGHVRLTDEAGHRDGPSGTDRAGTAPSPSAAASNPGGTGFPGEPRQTAAVPHARVSGGAAGGTRTGGEPGGRTTAPTAPSDPSSPSPSPSPSVPSADTHHAYGPGGWGAAGGVPGDTHVVPGQSRAPRIESTHGTGSAHGPAASAHGEEPGPYGDPGGTRKGTPTRGTEVPPGVRRRGGLTAWARRLAGGRAEQPDAEGTAYETAGAAELPATAAHLPETWPDPATLLLTALGPGPRLWERGPRHPEALTVRLGTADRTASDGSGLVPAVPVTAGLREAGALGLAGPRERLTGLARAVVAQLAALHSPDILELVLISTDRARSVGERTAEWAWLGWLPHLRPAHGQDCRLLLAYDRDQATARADELLRRLEDQAADAAHAAGAPSAEAGPYTVLVVDGDPGCAALRDAVARLAREGARAGIHVVCLAETAAASPASPVTETYEAACAVAPGFRECGAVALLSGDVATALRLIRVARGGLPGQGRGQMPEQGALDDGPDGALVGHGTVAAVDAVSAAWAERFARALAPLRTDGTGDRHARVSAPLPQAARLLDELGLARATPASLLARWADAADDTEVPGGRARAVLGAGPRGPVCTDLAAEGPHLLVEGPPGSGRTELLRSIAASLAAADRPDRLGIVLIDGRDRTGGKDVSPSDGLGSCTDLPHVSTHLTANDPVRMREFAQALSAELKRRAELLGRLDFTEWHTGREVSGRMVTQRSARGAHPAHNPSGSGDLDTPTSSTIRLRPAAAGQRPEPGPPLARLVVVVDDLDALLSPALGSPGRPSAGSVVRALEAVAREGERLGVHLVAAIGTGGRAAESEPTRSTTLRVTLETPTPGPDEPAPGRGRLTGADGRVTPFQGGRVTGRIPRTATLRPTVVPLEWHRMGDPPARRPVRELGNGPTDLALLASALERAARSVAATQVPSLP
ncbi:FHA domain-containing protein [Streptomyces sp. NPDC059786]|uniref:FHA domain-containing protein n=1 Tax=Streptomyces sp. NPDC059786 TaxID=3346946 RepID=UPI00364642C5